MERFQGEYDPPHEVHEMRVARLVGAGWLSVATEGIAIGGTLVDRPAPFDTRPYAVGVVLLGFALSIVTGAYNQILPVAITVGGALYGLAVWLEREVPLLQTVVPWGRIERIVQYPRDPERLAILVDGGRELPGTVYFTALDGPDPVLAAIRAARPELEIDTESAALAAQEAEANAGYDPSEHIYTPDPEPDDDDPPGPRLVPPLE